MDESVCAPTANLFISYTPFQLALSFHVIVSGVTLFLIIPVIQEVKKSYFHPNCKILLIYLLIWFILHALSMGFTMGYHVFLYWTKSGCEIFVSSLFCDISRGPANLTVMICSSLHVALCLERIIAKYYGGTYEFQKASIGWIFAIVCTLFAFMTYSYILEKEDFSSMVPYCTLGNQYTLPHLDLWFRYTPIVDISCLLIMIMLAFRNGKAKKSYDLNVSFSTAENRNASLLLVPFTVVHLVIALSFIFLCSVLPKFFPKDWPTMFIKTLMSAFYIYPLYTVIGCICLSRILKKIRTKRRLKIDLIRANYGDLDLIHQSYAKYW